MGLVRCVCLLPMSLMRFVRETIKMTFTRCLRCSLSNSPSLSLSLCLLFPRLMNLSRALSRRFPLYPRYVQHWPKQLIGIGALLLRNLYVLALQTRPTHFLNIPTLTPQIHTLQPSIRFWHSFTLCVRVRFFFLWFNNFFLNFELCSYTLRSCNLLVSKDLRIFFPPYIHLNYISFGIWVLAICSFISNQSIFECISNMMRFECHFYRNYQLTHFGVCVAFSISIRILCNQFLRCFGWRNHFLLHWFEAFLWGSGKEWKRFKFWMKHSFAMVGNYKVDSIEKKSLWSRWKSMNLEYNRTNYTSSE